MMFPARRHRLAHRAHLVLLSLASLASAGPARAGDRFAAANPRTEPGASAVERAGADDPEKFLNMYARGYHSSQAAHVFLVPRPGYYLSSKMVVYDHGSPWAYDVHVPLLIYGPGVVRPIRVTEPARPYDLVPTLSRALRVPPPPAAQGRIFEEILVPRQGRPRVAVIFVLDQVGHHDLVRWGDRLPTLSRMMRQGAWFEDCRLDYLPSATAVTHASVGAGAPPGVTGVTANMVVRRGDQGPRLENVWESSPGQLVPAVLQVPTLADWLDPMFGNDPVVISSVWSAYAAGGLAGHGLSHPGGDADILVFYNSKDGVFTTDERYFRIPDYIRAKTPLPDIDLEAEIVALDVETPYRKGVRILPEFARFEAENVLEMMDREGVGRDEAPDLVMLNLKTTDLVGHMLGHDHPYYLRTLQEVDRFLERAESWFRRNGALGSYVIGITADHGVAPADAVRVNRNAWGDALGAALDRDGDRDGKSAVIGVETCLVYLDLDELRDEGLSIEDVRDRILKDSRILHAWTRDEVRDRRMALWGQGGGPLRP